MKDRPILLGLLNATVVILGVLLGVPFVLPTPPAPPPGNPTQPEPPATMPEPTPPKPKEPSPDPLNAIVRIASGGTGCSATVIGPRRVDGRYWVLTAAHCVRGVGQHWTMTFRDGRKMGSVVVNFDRKSDHAWMLTESNAETLPFALLVDRDITVTEAIWHAGFGVDRPSNREDGHITAGPNSDGQIQMELSVSSGDSGGGIILTRDGKVVSCVCCTSVRGRKASVWGAGPDAIKRSQVALVGMDEWQPMEIPLKMPDKN